MKTIERPEVRRRTTLSTFVVFFFLALTGVAVGSGHMLAVIIATMVTGVIALAMISLWTESAVDIAVGAGMLAISFSGIEVGPVTAPDIFLIPAALMLALRHALTGGHQLPKWLIGSACLILVAGLLSQVLFVDLPNRSVIILLQFSLSLLYVPLVVSVGTRSHHQLHRLSGLFVASACLNALFALLAYFRISDIASQLTGFQGFLYNGGRPAGFTAHPNQLGLLSVLALPLALYLCRRSRLWVITLPLLFSGVMVSGSRTALFGLIVAAVATLWMEGRVSTVRLVKGTLTLGLIALIVTGLGVDLALDRIIAPDDSVGTATDERAGSLTEGLKDIRDYPLTGVGFGRHAHSLYLEILQGAGVLCLAGFLWFATRMFATARRLRHNELASAAGASLLTWLVTGILHPGLYDRYLYVPAGILLGIWFLERHACSSGDFDHDSASLPRVPVTTHRAVRV